MKRYKIGLLFIAMVFAGIITSCDNKNNNTSTNKGGKGSGPDGSKNNNNNNTGFIFSGEKLQQWIAPSKDGDHWTTKDVPFSKTIAIDKSAGYDELAICYKIQRDGSSVLGSDFTKEKPSLDNDDIKIEFSSGDETVIKVDSMIVSKSLATIFLKPQNTGSTTANVIITDKKIGNKKHTEAFNVTVS